MFAPILLITVLLIASQFLRIRKLSDIQSSYVDLLSSYQRISNEYESILVEYQQLEIDQNEVKTELDSLIRMLVELETQRSESLDSIINHTELIIETYGIQSTVISQPESNN